MPSIPSHRGPKPRTLRQVFHPGSPELTSGGFQGVKPRSSSAPQEMVRVLEEPGRPTMTRGARGRERPHTPVAITSNATMNLILFLDWLPCFLLRGGLTCDECGALGWAVKVELTPRIGRPIRLEVFGRGAPFPSAHSRATTGKPHSSGELLLPPHTAPCRAQLVLARCCWVLLPHGVCCCCFCALFPSPSRGPPTAYPRCLSICERVGCGAQHRRPTVC